MKKIKKILAMAMCICILFSCNIYLFAADSTAADLERGRQVLLQAGWTEEKIDDMLTDEMILEYKDAISVVSSETVYMKATEEGTYEVSEEECLNGVNTIKQLRREAELDACDVAPAAIVPGIGPGPGGADDSDTTYTTDGYMRFYLSVFDMGDEVYLLHADFEWLVTPRFRYTDYFSIGFNDGVFRLPNSDFSYQYKADVTYNNDGVITEDDYIITIPTTYINSVSGLAIGQDLVNDVNTDDSSAIYRNHRFSLQYQVKLSTGDTNGFSAVSNYYHQEYDVDVSASVSFDDEGELSVSTSVSGSTVYRQLSPNPQVGVVL